MDFENTIKRIEKLLREPDVLKYIAYTKKIQEFEAELIKQNKTGAKLIQLVKMKEKFVLNKEMIKEKNPLVAEFAILNEKIDSVKHETYNEKRVR